MNVTTESLRSASNDDAPSRPEVTTADTRFPRWLLGIAAGAVLVGVVLRFLTASDLWLDEALTVNIAKLPLSDLHGALRQDGAPPAYYLLLHGWMSVFGSSDVAVRALSGLFSVATLPVIWFAGRRVDRQAPPGPITTDSPRQRLLGGLAVIVLATSPFAIRYGTEARPYALVMFLVSVGYLAFRRALERPSLGRLAVVALLTGLLLYTHYWSIYLFVALLGFLVWRMRRGDSSARRAALAVAASMAVGALTFLPWLPTFLFQSQHTATPWGSGQVPIATLRQTLDQFSNGASLVHTPADAVALCIVLLIALALFGRPNGAGHVDLELRTTPAVRWEALIAFVALVVGLTAAWVTDGAYDARYASVLFPLVVLVVAYGFTAFSGRTLMAGAVAVFAVVCLVGSVSNAFDNRTQAGEIADVILADARPGDVVAYCPDQLGPSVSRLLTGRNDLKQLTFPAGAAPQRVDWIDYHERISRTDPAAFARKVIARAAATSTIWYVTSSSYYGIETECAAVQAALSAERPGSSIRVSQDEKTFFESAGLVEFPGKR